jgi:hypothetical protein
MCVAERGKERSTSSTLAMRRQTKTRSRRGNERAGGAPDGGRQLHHGSGSGGGGELHVKELMR